MVMMYNRLDSTTFQSTTIIISPLTHTHTLHFTKNKTKIPMYESPAPTVSIILTGKASCFHLSFPFPAIEPNSPH
jgi:hypothetical protein